MNKDSGGGGGDSRGLTPSLVGFTNTTDKEKQQLQPTSAKLPKIRNIEDADISDIVSDSRGNAGTTGTYNNNLTKKQASALGASTSAIRGMLLQPLYFWYRTPLKLFRPLRVDYLATARALLPSEELAKRISFRSTTIGMLSHAVHQKGWKFLPRYVIQPMVANWAVGFALFTTYTAALPAAYMRSSVMQTVYPDSPKKPTTIVPPFAAGALAGLAQSIVATPLDALRIRFEVEDMLNGRYQSWFGFVKDKVTEDGIARLYRGFRITAVKDVLGFSAFFGIFEFTKIELLEVYRNLMKEGRKIRELAKKQGTSEDGIVKSIITGADSDSDKFTRSEIAQLRRMAIYQRYNDLVPDLDVDEVASNPQQAQPSPRAPIKAPLYVLPSLLLPPYLGQASCILIAGGTAALAYQAIDYPLEQLRNYVYTELAKNEIKTVENKILHALRKHYRTIKKEILSSKTRPDVEWHPYHHFWNGLKQHAAKELNRSPESFWTPIRYLYSGWFGVAIRSVPATSIGLLFYEIVKQWLEDEYM